MQLKEAYRKATALFKKRGWKVFKFQRETWKAYASGKSGLVHAPTGTGKTYAVWVPPLLEWMVEEQANETQREHPSLRVLWITPLRALVEDTRISLLELCRRNGPAFMDGRARETGDASGGEQNPPKKTPSFLPSNHSRKPFRAPIYPDFKQSASELKRSSWTNGMNCFRPNGGSNRALLGQASKWNPRVHLGIVCHSGQPGASPSRPFSDLLPRKAHRRWSSKKVSNRIHHSERHGALSLGRTPGWEARGTSRRKNRKRGNQPRIHKRSFSNRILVQRFAYDQT